MPSHGGDEVAATRNRRRREGPWSGFDLINAFNCWKLTEAAGIDDDGKAGLGWRHEVCQQVFEEAAVDLGRALTGFSEGKQGKRAGRPPRFPRFKRKATARKSFRIRNRKKDVRIGTGVARSIRLPKFGDLEVRECTRRLRRMLKKGRAKILFATVSFRSDARWHITLNVEAAEFHSALRHTVESVTPTVGIDRGLKTFAVIAAETGAEVARIESPSASSRSPEATEEEQIGSAGRILILAIVTVREPTSRRPTHASLPFDATSSTEYRADWPRRTAAW